MNRIETIKIEVPQIFLCVKIGRCRRKSWLKYDFVTKLLKKNLIFATNISWTLSFHREWHYIDKLSKIYAPIVSRVTKCLVNFDIHNVFYIMWYEFRVIKNFKIIAQGYATLHSYAEERVEDSACIRIFYSHFLRLSGIRNMFHYWM